jgi:hypothetical protein
MMVVHDMARFGPVGEGGLRRYRQRIHQQQARKYGRKTRLFRFADMLGHQLTRSVLKVCIYFRGHPTPKGRAPERMRPEGL